MKTTPSHLKATLLSMFAVLLAPCTFAQVDQSSTASTAGIAIDRTQYFTQSSGSTPAAQSMPFSLNFNIRGTSANISAWGPGFYKPGSGGVPQTGASSATNTGTLNFSTTPNNGGGYMFVHDFATNADLVAAYPLGAYGVKFSGANAPTPNTFTAGLEFATSGSTYPSVTPQIASANNGAAWDSGVLKINASGVTTLGLNAFPEYSSTTYGSVITAGIYDGSGNVVAPVSVEAYYLPTLGVNQPAVTQLTIDGSWLTPGVTYTMELQYIVIASAPVEGYLNGENFQGVASYLKNTSLSIKSSASVVTPPTGTYFHADFNGDQNTELMMHNGSEFGVQMMNGTTMTGYVSLAGEGGGWGVIGTGDFNHDGQTDIIWRNGNAREVGIWLMNGTTSTGYTYVATEGGEWQVFGAGDFNGDGQSDLFWRNPVTGEVGTWLMNGTTSLGYVPLATESSNWQIIGTGDFNGDGKTDIIWRNAGAREVGVWLMNGTTSTGYTYLATEGGDWEVIGAGDFNHDHKSDLIWRNNVNGEIGTWLMNGTTSMGFVYITTESGGWHVNNN